MSTTHTPETPETNLHAKRKRPFLLTGEGWPYLLVPLIPVAIFLELTHAGAVPIFVASALGVIPTAALMGRATEELAARSGPGIGGFLNVTFGNAPELIIALFALAAGLHEVVKASIVGSILGNILLVLGVSMLVGGARRDRQRFEARAASAQSLMLLLAAVALIMPAIFELVAGGGLPDPAARAIDFPESLQELSVGVAIVLLVSYAAGLLFSLKTHRALFNPSHDEEDHGGEPWTVRRSIIMLAIAGAAVGVMSEILVSSITEASETIGLSTFFVGVIVVAIRQRRRTLGRGLLRQPRQDGHRRQHRRRLRRPNRAVRRPRPRPRQLPHRTIPDGPGLQRLRTRRHLPRHHHRRRNHPTRRIHLVRRPPTPRHLHRPRPHLLLRQLIVYCNRLIRAR
jgi:Ca2+:H+ antiporter